MNRLRTVMVLAAVVATTTVPAAADVRATVMLRSGERVSGNLEALDGGTLFVRESRDSQRKLPFTDVALIDSVGGAEGLPETELREARGSAHLLLLKDGSATKGRLTDIDGGRGTSEGTAAELTFVFKTSGGEERRLKTDRIARLYLGNFPSEAAQTAEPAAQTAEPGTVNVAANQRWVDTGIVVTRGQTVRFQSTGEVRLSGDSGDTATAAGSKRGRRADGAPIPSVLAGALIGRVGTGVPFGIGDQGAALSMPAAGRLYLAVNDDEVADNGGAFAVRVTPDAAPNTGSRPGRRRSP